MLRTYFTREEGIEPPFRSQYVMRYALCMVGICGYHYRIHATGYDNFTDTMNKEQTSQPESNLICINEPGDSEMVNMVVVMVSLSREGQDLDQNMYDINFFMVNLNESRNHDSVPSTKNFSRAKSIA
jgi:hypothetical protein